jgi:hypothetical protein
LANRACWTLELGAEDICCGSHSCCLRADRPFLNVSGTVEIWTPLSVGEEHAHSKIMLAKASHTAFSSLESIIKAFSLSAATTAFIPLL